MPFHQLIIQQDESISYKFTRRDFELSWWQSQANSEALSGGRGGSQKIHIQDQFFVLRQYLRGGLMAKFLHNQYLWTGFIHCRPFCENRVVNIAIDKKLLVPQVAAFLVQRTGFFYRAAIISSYIVSQGTLASFLYERELPERQWTELGLLIKRLHQAGIYHADLNANNILIGKEMSFHLIDFDKAKIMPKEGAWRQQNINRLLRSLKKIQTRRIQQNLAFHFNDDHWMALLSG